MHGNLSKAQKVFSSLPILLVYIPLGYIVTLITLYFILNPIVSLATRITFAIIYYTIILFIIILHLMAIITSPGIVPKQYVLNEYQLKHSVGLYCNKCSNYRPIRASHCNQCNACVLKMDHHCTFISNCVGCNNHKSFFLFLSYSLIGLLISLVQLIILIVKCNDIFIRSEKTSERYKSVREYMLQYKIGCLVWIGIVMIVILMTSGSVMYVKQLRGLIRNSTMIEEDVYGEVDNPYSMRNTMKNVKSVLGESLWEWFIPLNRSKENGLNYMVYSDQIKANKDTNKTNKKNVIAIEKETSTNVNNNNNITNRTDNSAKGIKNNKVSYYSIKDEIDSSSLKKFDSSQVSSNYDFSISHIKK